MTMSGNGFADDVHEPPPVYCRPRAYGLFADQLPIIESADGLLNASVAIAMHEMADADTHAVDMKLQELADRVSWRSHDTSFQTRLEHVHDLLFDGEGFTGNSEDYYDPRNSYVPMVLKSKRGIPITLTVIYKSVLHRLDIPVVGINAPGHFLAGVPLPGEDRMVIIDTFHRGKVLSLDEVFDRIEQSTGQVVSRSKRLLTQATHREWLVRMLQNLQLIFGQLNRKADFAAMQELMALLAV